LAPYIKSDDSFEELKRQYILAGEIKTNEELKEIYEDHQLKKRKRCGEKWKT